MFITSENMLCTVWQNMHTHVYTVVIVKCTQLLSSLSADCLTQFVKSSRSHAAGANNNPTARNIIDCKNACLNNDGCVGFDFDNTNNGCWLHTSAIIRPLQPSTTMDNYKRTEGCKMSGKYSHSLVRRSNWEWFELRTCRSAVSIHAPLNV